MEGLVVTYYKSKKDVQNWVPGMNIFKVIYDRESKQLTKITSLGNGYTNGREKQVGKFE
ncbi:hypothetical protein [Enterococcus faecium]|uniref:hypothetical protein n=1 Tax=Enterococcus faecium TaxID=1352 RepID=UPI0014851580|nr:hypothetical protein [Enterococcus faecium]